MEEGFRKYTHTHTHTDMCVHLQISGRTLSASCLLATGSHPQDTSTHPLLLLIYTLNGSLDCFLSVFFYDYMWFIRRRD